MRQRNKNKDLISIRFFPEKRKRGIEVKIFKRFFGKFFWIGIIVILVAGIIELTAEKCFVANLFVSVLSTVGVALLLGAIFDFSKNSEEFISFMSDIIKRIIITKDFLGTLTKEEQKNILELVVTPTDVQLEQCSSINQYYKKSINSFIDLYNRPFKTNLTINLIAKIENDIVICEGSLSYRRYKVGEKYKSIETSFERIDSAILNTYILLPDGSRRDLREDDDIEVKSKDELQEEKVGKKYMTNIPEEYNQYPYITLCKDIKEIGHDHWITFNWTSLTPCDGISFELYCIDDLVIKEHKVFDNPKLYETNVNVEKNKINILSNSWLNEYTGFTITISKK